MATSTPAGAPRPPQNRVQRADSEGNFTPVVDVPQEKREAAPEPETHAYKVGDKVQLVGRITEINSPQGGQTNLLVQLPQGVVWLRDYHVEVSPEVPSALAPTKIDLSTPEGIKSEISNYRAGIIDLVALLVDMRQKEGVAETGIDSEVKALDLKPFTEEALGI